MAYTEAQKRRMRFQAGVDAGMPEDEAGLVTYPELAPEAAVMQQPSSVPKVESVNESDLSTKEMNKEIARDDMAGRYAEQYGITKPEAYTFMDEVFKGLPETATPINFDRFDLFVTEKRRGFAYNLASKSFDVGQTLKDIDFLGTAAYAVFGSSQQGLFGALAGESKTDIAARLWPVVDIRDENDVMERKAVIPMAVKGSLMGAAGELIDFVSFGEPGVSKKLKGGMRDIAMQLAETEYKQNMLTGQELIEYWMHGDGLLGTPLPAQGTQERKEYDAAVYENASQNYMDMHTDDVARLAIGGALLDVFVDPLLLLNEAPTAVGKIVRKGVPASSRARVTGAIAGKTRRQRDLLTAVDDAEQWVDEAAAALNHKATATTKKHHAAAEANLVKQMARSEVQDVTGETILLSHLPRIRPEHIKPVGDVFLSAEPKLRKAATTSFLKEKLTSAKSVADDMARELKEAAGAKELGFDAKELGIDTNIKAADVADAKELVKGWTETSEWFGKRMSAARSNRTEAFFKQAKSNMEPYSSTSIALSTPDGDPLTKIQALTVIQKNIERGVAQGASMDEVVQWERAYTSILQGGDTPPMRAVRSTKTVEQIVTEANEAQRIKALSSDPTPLRDYSQTDTMAQLEQRIAYGPDQTERAAEAARILASGGTIDDAMFHGTSVELYNTSYGQRMRPHSGTEMRGVKAVSEKDLAADVEWLGKDPVNNTVDAANWQQSVAEKSGDLWARALHPRSWNMRPTGMLQNVREVMRTLQSVAPRAYTRIHNATRAQEFELNRMNEFFSQELSLLGVHRVVEGSKVVNSQTSERFYRILNLDPTGDDFSKAMMSLTETERRSLRRVRQELDFVADKLGLRGSDRYIEGYIDHVFDTRWTDKGYRPPVFDGMNATSRVQNPYMLARSGKKGYVEDLDLALDFYTRAASQKLHMEPLFMDLEEIGRLHLLKNPGDVWFGDYLNNIIANFKGKPSTLGQWADRAMGSLNARMRARPAVGEAHRKAGGVVAGMGKTMGTTGEFIAGMPGIGKIKRLGGNMASDGVRMNKFGSEMSTHGTPLYKVGDVSRTTLGVTALSYSSVLGGSGRYFPMAISTAIATNVSARGMFNTAKGMLIMGTKQGRELGKKAGLEKQWSKIMEDAAWTKLGSLASNMPSFNGITVVGPSIGATENLIRGWAFHATLSELMNKSKFNHWDDAIKAGMANSFMHEAIRCTEESMHLFGQLGKPPIMARASKSGSAAATQFLSFIPKQMEELFSQAMDNVGRIGQYMLISGYIQRVAARTGMDVSDYVGAGFLPKSPNDATSIAMETMKSLVVATGENASLLAGEGDMSRASRANDMFLRNATNFIPTAMAVQRTARGIAALQTGKVFREGKMVRDVDLGGFKWDHSKSYLENYMELPKGLMSMSGDPSAPTEIMSILTSLNSPQGTLERQQYMGMRASTGRRQAQRTNITNRLREAQLSGNSEAFSAALQEAIESGMLPPDVTNMVERTGMEIAVPRLMRHQLKTQQQLIDSIEVMHREYYMHQIRSQ